MVVGGLPTPCDNHAERVLNMAFGMMEASIKVLSPADRMPLKVCSSLLNKNCFPSIAMSAGSVTDVAPCSPV